MCGGVLKSLGKQVGRALQMPIDLVGDVAGAVTDVFSPQIPKPPEPPPAPEEPPTIQDVRVQDARKRERRRAASITGQGSTILTGGLANTPFQGAFKTLLGQ